MDKQNRNSHQKNTWNTQWEYYLFILECVPEMQYLWRELSKKQGTDRQQHSKPRAALSLNKGQLVQTSTVLTVPTQLAYTKPCPLCSHRSVIPRPAHLSPRAQVPCTRRLAQIPAKIMSLDLGILQRLSSGSGEDRPHFTNRPEHTNLK